MQADEKTCPECAEAVKAAAKACKHCGYRFDTAPLSETPPGKSAPSSNYSMVMLWIFGLLIAAALTAFVLRMNWAATRTDNPDIEGQGKAFVTKEFLDPSSAQFQDIFSNDRCVTGRVNGKNAYGAYIGFSDFYFDSKLGRGKIAPAHVDPFSPSYSAYTSAIDTFNDERQTCTVGEAEAKRFKAAVQKRLHDKLGR
jgi:hypothetical protein